MTKRLAQYDDAQLWAELWRRRNQRLDEGYRKSAVDAATQWNEHQKVGVRLSKQAYAWMWGWHDQRTNKLIKRLRREGFEIVVREALEHGSEPE